MNHYDFIIAGAGLSGLSLALHMINSPLRDRSILIVDPDLKERNDRTWSYWSDRPTPFDGSACRTWDRLHLAGLNGEMLVNLRRYRYRTIRGSDFYEHARRVLAKHPSVTWLRGKVETIEDNGDAVRVIISDSDFLSNVRGQGAMEALRFAIDKSALVVAFLAIDGKWAQEALAPVLASPKFRLVTVKSLADFGAAAAALADALFGPGSPARGAGR